MANIVFMWTVNNCSFFTKRLDVIDEAYKQGYDVMPIIDSHIMF